MTSSLLARVALSRVLEPGEPKALALVAELGPEVVLEALHEQAQRPGASEGLVGRLAGIEPARDLERAAALGIADEQQPGAVECFAVGHRKQCPPSQFGSKPGSMGCDRPI